MFIRVGRLQFIALAFVSLILLCFGQEFIILWVGQEFASAYYVVLALVLPVTIPLIQTLGIEIQRAMNKHKFRSYLYLAVATTNILVSIPLAVKYGAVGAAIGTSISIIIGHGLVMNWYYAKKICLNITRFWLEIVKILPALLPPVITGVVTAHFIHINSYLKLGVALLIFSVCYTVSLWLLGLNQEEKVIVLSVLKRSRQKAG